MESFSDNSEAKVSQIHNKNFSLHIKVVWILKMKCIEGLGLNPRAGAAVVLSDQCLPFPPIPHSLWGLLLPIQLLHPWKLLPIIDATHWLRCWGGRHPKPGPSWSFPGTFMLEQEEERGSPRMKPKNVRLSMGCFLLSRKKQPKKMKMTARERERWSKGLGFICPRCWHTPVLPLVWLYQPTLVAHEFHFWPQLV